jgi:predicted ATPase/class 3 adenylate cyclase
MRCASCGFENPEEAKFCEECGTPFVRVCPSCGQQARSTAKFCPECGTALRAEGKPTPPRSRSRKGAQRPKRATQSARQAAPAASRPASPEAERRQLTVMFCDLVGSTPLAEKLDPEELRQVIIAYQEMCAHVIRRFEGYLARYIGDGLLVYFGYPQAHEDDAQRAIRVGLGIVAALPHLNTQLTQTVGALHGSPLQVRIGIHTGLVVVGDMGGGGYRDPMAIVGETPNIAARLQGIAEPDTVVISEATHRLVQGLFACHARGPQELKGVSTPVLVYRVLRESEVRSRFEAAVSKGLTPLVGREEELGLLRRRWEHAKAGEGQVVLLNGEPGIGKSRLVQMLKEQASAEGATRIEFSCSAFHQNSAFYPIIEHLQRLLQFAPHDPPQAKLTKLQQTLSAYRFPQVDTLALLAVLLSLPHPEGIPPLTLSPQKQKQKTQEALVAWIVEEAEKAAVYCAWEDLHWADPSTLEVLTLFLDQVPTTRLFVVLTGRPEFSPPWPSRAYLTTLTLNRLPRLQAEEMVAKVTGGKALPVEVVHQVVSKTDGVPLFVEELTRMVLESGLLTAVDEHYELTGPLPPLAIPSTLQDSLMARLDRLATVREIAQLGATIGREFSYELIHAVSPLDEGMLQQGLKQLVGAELVYQRGLVPQAYYLFKHALIQDTAYQSLLKSKRQQYHNQIAQVLEEKFSETKETQPELLAHHYTEAGLMGQALPYWQRAGQRARQRSAHIEAISHLTKGLELLKTLPDTPERAQQELRLLTTLGPALIFMKGYGAPEVEQIYARAYELCQQGGRSHQLIGVLQGLLAFHLVRGEVRKARDLAEQIFRLAQRVATPTALIAAHGVLGISLYHLGELSAAREHVEQAWALYNPQAHNPRVIGGLADPGVLSLSYAASTLWCLGYPDQALEKVRVALLLAHEVAHPFSLASALTRAAALHFARGEVQAGQEQVEALIVLATDQGFPDVVALETARRGVGLVEQGEVEAGIAQLQHGLAGMQALGQEIGRPSFLACLAEAYGKRGQTEEGLRVMAEALAAVDRIGEHYYEAELHRLKGALLLQSKVSNPTSEAAECFQQAITVARRQSAKSLELRAVMSLSRLWQQQGKKEEARQMLAEIYGWFTEGFDTKDLQEAKALLEELR